MLTAVTKFVTLRVVIKTLRDCLNITQAGLADVLGTSRSFIALVETGRRRLPRRRAAALRALADQAARRKVGAGGRVRP
jgi:transcriptional regulator with XRE-family HTH domain